MTDKYWEELQDEYGTTVSASMSDPINHVKDIVVKLSWDAFQEFDEKEWQNTLRHELVHIE